MMTTIINPQNSKISRDLSHRSQPLQSLPKRPGLAFVYPGQGSQLPGMGQDLCLHFKVAQEVFEEASEALGLDLKKLCFHSTPEELQLTENTQPAILVTSVAATRVLNTELGLYPSYVAGHSIGEYSACVQAGVFSLVDAVKAVRIRGQAMQEAVPFGQGGMAALMGLTEEQALELCAYVSSTIKLDFSEDSASLSCANFNSPGQIVVSGHKSSIEKLITFKGENLWKKNPPKFKVIPLKVSAPFHCSLMKPAQDKMAQVLENLNFQDALIPVIQNVEAQKEEKAQILRKNLIEQISAPVRWTQTMIELQNLGVKKVLEVGQGQVLSGLFKKSGTGLEVLPFQKSLDLEAIKNL
jgi:[acyl-carrier-protein] S-malonyltransferase